MKPFRLLTQLFDQGQANHSTRLMMSAVMTIRRHPFIQLRLPIGRG